MDTEEKIATRKQEYWHISTIAALIILADQLTKFFARDLLDLHIPVEVIPNFFNLTLVHNYGAAWGILQGFRIGFLILALAMSAVILVKHRAIFGIGKLAKCTTALLLGGIIGNAIDRAVFGYVTDFIDLWHGSYHFPCFNIADSAICIGVALYFIISLKKSN
jgi:signal peptidase II